MKGTTLSFFFFVAVVLASMDFASAATFSLWNQTDFDNCVKLQASVYDYRMYWSIVGDNIEIGLAAKANGWMGLGISTDGSMDSSGNGSDVWVGWIGGDIPACGGSGCVLDYRATAHQQPIRDTTNHLLNRSFGSVDGYQWIKFQRLLVTNDSQDRDITPDKPQHVIHALGNSLPTDINTFEQHISGTNFASYIQFGQSQWACNDSAPAPAGTTVYSYENPTKTWRLNWTLIDDGDSIEFNVSARTSSWWALGINNNENMVGADIMWCSFSGGPAVVVDRKATAHETPGSDAVQNVELVSAESVYGWSTCQLRRKLNTGDAQGDNVIGGGFQKLLWAYDASGKRSLVERDCPDFCQHASNTKGLATVDFLTGVTTGVSTDDKRKAHGILMLFAWGLLAVAGAFIARYCKTPQGKWVLYGYVWVHLHGFIGILTFVVNLIAFALIVSWVSDREIDHFKGAHEIIGIIMFICAFFLPLVGVIAELFLKKYRDPNWVGYLIGLTHAWFGKALVLLGLVEIYLGLALYCVPTYVMVTYGVSIACMIVLFLAHEVLRWFAPWGSWLGGPGFTYQRVDDDKNGSTEMKDFSPENKIPWMNSRAPVQPPLVVKICLWVVQVGLAVAIIGLWIATAVGIGEKDINDPNDSYDSTCAIGTKFQ